MEGKEPEKVTSKSENAGEIEPSQAQTGRKYGNNLLPRFLSAFDEATRRRERKNSYFLPGRGRSWGVNTKIRVRRVPKKGVGKAPL